MGSAISRRDENIQQLLTQLEDLCLKRLIFMGAAYGVGITNDVGVEAQGAAFAIIWRQRLRLAIGGLPSACGLSVKPLSGYYYFIGTLQ